MKRERDELFDWYLQMLGVIAALPPTERQEFDEWDANRPPHLATSDWQGFQKYIGNRPQGNALPKAKSKAFIPPNIRWQVWERDGFKCQKCGSRQFLSVDHIIPESKGGTLDLDNLQTLCTTCNCRKGDRQ